jgi:ABC-type uncharacterized transport system substrate-binding protein
MSGWGRRGLARACAAAAALACGASARAADVAILKSAETLAWRPTIDALRKGAGASHTFTEFDLRGDKTEAARVAGALKGKPGLLVVAMGPLAAQAARDAVPEAPLVYCMVPDPAHLNLAGPGIAGVAFTVPVKNQLAAFRLVNPRGVRVGVLYSEAASALVQDALKAAASVRLALVAKPIASVKDIPTTLRTILSGAEAVDAVWVPPDPLLMQDDSRRFLMSEVAKAGKPVYASSGTMVQEGALVSNGPDFTSIGELVGELVARLAGGEKGRLEMLVPRGELVINKKMASKLGIDVSADALKAANRTY